MNRPKPPAPPEFLGNPTRDLIEYARFAAECLGDKRPTHAALFRALAERLEELDPPAPKARKAKTRPRPTEA